MSGKGFFDRLFGIFGGDHEPSDDDLANAGAALGAMGAFDDDPVETDRQDDAFGDDAFSEGAFVDCMFIEGEDMKLLDEAGYSQAELDLMDRDELRDAMEDAGVDPDFYDLGQ